MTGRLRQTSLLVWLQINEYSYTHRFIVAINGLEVFYEPDEERKYKAILNDGNQHLVKDTHHELIKLVAEKIESIHL